MTYSTAIAASIEASRNRIAALRQCTPLQLVALNREGYLTVFAPGYQYAYKDLPGTALQAIVWGDTDAEIVWGSEAAAEACDFKINRWTRSPMSPSEPTRANLREKIAVIGQLAAYDARKVLAGMAPRTIRTMVDTGCLTVMRAGKRIDIDATYDDVFKLIRGARLNGAHLIWMYGTVDQRDLTSDDIDADKAALERLVELIG